jgi:hypothetical protein
MPKAKVSFIQEHVEKLVLGACALVLIGSVVYFLVLGPFKTADGQGPGELCDLAARTADESLQRVRSKKHTPDAAARGALAREGLEKVFGPGEDAGLIAMANIQPRFAPIVQWAPPLVDTGTVDASEKHDLAPLLPPEKPIVRAGRATFSIADPIPLESVATRGGSRGGEAREVNRAYAYVTAQIDLLAQGLLNRRTRYSPGKFDAPLVIVGVQLQRRPAGDENALWEDVPIYSPFKPIELPDIKFTSEGRFATADDGERFLAFRKLLLREADLIARTPPPEMVGGKPVDIRPRVPWLVEGDPKSEELAGDEADAPSAPAGQLTRGGRAPKKVVPTPERRFNKWFGFADRAMKEGELDLAAVLLEAALGEEGVPSNLREKAVAKQRDLDERRRAAKLPPMRTEYRRPEKMMPIAALDLDAVAGQTYVYRIRYEILNPFVGEPAELKDPSDAERLTLVSEWSPPSAPVEIRSDTYFYLTSVNPKARTAEIEIFRLHSKQWFRTAAKIAVGEPIGKSQKIRRDTVNFYTGAVALDVLAENGGALVYVDRMDGRLHERSVTRDAADPKRTELLDLAGKTR